MIFKIMIKNSYILKISPQPKFSIPKTHTIMRTKGEKKKKNYSTFLLQLDLCVPLKDWIKLKMKFLMLSLEMKFFH